jgi:hypothetical protein
MRPRVSLEVLWNRRIYLLTLSGARAFFLLTGLNAAFRLARKRTSIRSPFLCSRTPKYGEASTDSLDRMV